MRNVFAVRSAHHFPFIIKEMVTIPQMIAVYVPEAKERHGRIPCPLHGGEGYNFSYTDRVFHCFVCSEEGDAIHFVQKLFGLDFRSAMKKINDDFALNLPFEGPVNLKQQEEIKKKAEELKRKYAEIEKAKQEKKRLFNALWDEWARLSNNMEKYSPKDMDEDPHPLFVEACHKLSYIEYQLDSGRWW